MEQDAERAARQALCAQLGTIDTSIGFLLLIIAAVLLSYCAVSVQRKGLCLALAGRSEAARALPAVYPIRRKAAAIIVGALGFFLCLAARGARAAAEGDDCAARRSADANLWASILVMAAAMVRLMDLDCAEGGRQARLVEEDALLV